MSEHPVKDQIFISKLTGIILENLGNEGFGVNELVHKAGLSHYSLNRRLHAITNKTIKQFIREVRLQRALEMLRNEEVTVSDVAYKTGFGSPAYFNKCFHDLFGFPPGEVRKGDFIKSKETDFAHDSHKQKWNFRSALIFISLGIIAVTVLTYLIYRIFLIDLSHDSSISPNYRQKSLAVLPFNNLGEDITDQYVYDGIMEEIYNSLTKIKELRVSARTSVEQFRNAKNTISEIGKILNVDYIVEGSGQKSGRTFRLRVQLIEVATDRHIWARSYQHRMKRTKRIFWIQSQIAQSIASELKATITLEEKELIEKVPTADITAYFLYLKANDFLNKYIETRDLSSYNTAVNLYNSSLGVDTTFARAYTGLAGAYYNRYQWETYFRDNYLDSMMALADKALSIDDQLEEAYYIKGIYCEGNGQIEEALENYDRALQINPNYYTAYKRRGWILTSIKNDYVTGIDNYHKALARISGKERSLLLRDLGFAYKDIGFFEKARYYYNEAFTLDSNKTAHYTQLGILAGVEGKRSEAMKIEKEYQGIDSTYIPAGFIDFLDKDEAYAIAMRLIDYYKKSGKLNLQESHRIGFALWRAGKFEEAEKYLNQQINYCEESIKRGRDIAHWKAAYYDLAITYAFLGNKETAYQYLDELTKGNTCQARWIYYLKYDPPLNSIRNEERFQKVLEDYQAKYQAEHERVKYWLEEQGML